MPPALEIHAGPLAREILRERGLRLADVDVIPAASGGPKWLVLAGLDRVLFPRLHAERAGRPLHLVGSSIGTWRLACLLQDDPLGALARFEAGYLAQRYPPRAPAALVSATSAEIVAGLLGPGGAQRIADHPWLRLHVVTTRCRGLVASEGRWRQTAGFTLALAANALRRRTLGWQMERVIFHNAADTSPFAHLSDLPTRHVALTAENVAEALLASGSIPIAMSGVRIPGAPDGVYRDGGVLDYHLDLDYGRAEGLVLYPHFAPRVTPGWFDKHLAWRRADPRNWTRAVLLSPSPELVATLHRARIPNVDDFYDLGDEERLAAWRVARAASERLGEELAELLGAGPLGDGRVKPLG